jgi:hypothetical protein
MLRRALCIAALVAGMGGAAGAADRFYAYNMTTSTEFTSLSLAPANTQRWGKNQTLNDKDHSLEASERLAITGISHGRFDVRLTDSKGHTCLKRAVDLTKETTFDIRDSDLATCR